MGSPTLPSAMALFTSEFGMGSGGSTPLWSSSNSFCVCFEVHCVVRWLFIVSLSQNTRIRAWIFNNSFWNSDNQGQTDAHHCWCFIVICVFVILMILSFHSSHHDLHGWRKCWDCQEQSPVKPLWCYMVKPHEQLVLVSSMPHSTYTPNLSTS